MTTLGLNAKKPAKATKSGKSKSKSQSDDAQDFIDELKKKEEASPETCLFC